MDGITQQENIWIPLRDGRQLAARLWLPEIATPAPAIVEYIPYRKRDMTRPRDEPMHSWFAAHGYACLRVDMYGSGDSDGVMHQMWLRQEQDDALDLIAWIAAQPWCSGAVALYGKSWGGYSAIQAAMVRPPALRAIVSVCAGDNRYDQALHYTGGRCCARRSTGRTSCCCSTCARPTPPSAARTGARNGAAAWMPTCR